MGTVEEFKQKYFTEEGIKSISNLLDSYLSIFNNKNISYPSTIRFWGFPSVEFHSEAELYGRIRLVSEWMNIPINIQFKELEFSDKTKKIVCYIERVINKEEIKDGNN